MQCFPPVGLSYNISSERRFTVCVGAHTLNMFLKNFPTGRKNQNEWARFPKWLKPLYHTRRGLSSQDMMKQHMGIRNISLTPTFQNEPASATCEAGHCQSLSCMGLCLCTLMYSCRPKTNLVVVYLMPRSRSSRAVMLRMATASVAGTTK